MKLRAAIFIILTACTSGIETGALLPAAVTPRPTPTYACSYFGQYDDLLTCQITSSANCTSQWQTFPLGGVSLCYKPVDGYAACAVSPVTWDWQYTPWSAWTSADAGVTFQRTRSLLNCSSAICYCSNTVVTSDTCVDEASCLAKTPLTPFLIPVYRFMYGSSHFLTLSHSEGGTMPDQGIGFYVSFYQLSGMVPLYRCFVTSTTDHFVSTDSSCESVASVTNEGLYGYIYSAATTGAVPLYRYYNVVTSDHLSTTDISEGAGYPNNDGIKGYVPLPP